MKKFLKVFVCLIAVITLAGCGSNENKLQEYIEENRSTIEAFSNSTIKAELLARNNSLVYKYTYTSTYAEAQVKSIKETLDKSLSSLSSTYKLALDECKKIAPDTKSVILEYYNGDNKLITSKEYK